MDDVLYIDGAHGEGGGQLLRSAVALAAITGRAIRVHDVRAGRPKPGLAPQHLAAVRAIAALCDAECDGLAPGSREVVFRPGPIRSGAYRFDVGTAGSVGLVLQAALPVMFHAPGPCAATVAGGTDVRQAPPLDYLLHVLLPRLRDMGCTVEGRVVRRGYHPRGGGEAVVTTRPARLRAPQAARPRRGATVRGLVHTANLPDHVAERMRAAAEKRLAQGGLGPALIDIARPGPDAATGTGGAIVLWTIGDGPVLGAGQVAERGVRAETLGIAAADALSADVAAGADVDIHAADQLLVYMALAHAPSAYRAREITRHARTVIWLAERFGAARFDVATRGGCVEVCCEPAKA
jgi:RNA 3'-phosphate cyclase